MTLPDILTATSGRELEDLGPRPDFVASSFGPVWRTDDDGDFLLPDAHLTGGVQAIGWIVDHLRGPDGPWMPTHEQMRLLLWWYAVRPIDLDDEEDPGWLYRDAVVQLVKGPIDDGEIVPTPDGWKRHGALGVGDRVYASDGSITTVTALPYRGRDESFRVRFSDGTAVECSGEHRWPVRVFVGNHRVSETVTVNEMVRRGLVYDRPLTNGKTKAVKGGVSRFRSLPTPALEGDRQGFVIDPYVLGYWLGDGDSDTPRITCHQDDLDWIRTEFSHLGMEPRPAENTHGETYRFRFGNGVAQKEMRRIGVLNRKHIPGDYLYASAEQRLSLLQGLVDSDGHVSARGGVEISLSDELLASDVFDLCLSLGLEPSVTRGRSTFQGKRYKDRWRIKFTSRVIQAARLPRKVERLRIDGGEKRARVVVAVEPIGLRDVSCITVEHESHEYLVGEGMVPTCNSGKDPIAAVISAVDLCGPSRPVAWRHPDGTESKKYAPGSQVIFGRNTNEPWIQVFGVSKDQTVNTMNYLQGLFTDEAKKKYQIEVNRGIIYAFGYAGRLEAVTSAPSTREGNRPSLVVKNEPHHWRENNDGWATAAVIDRNVNKMRGPLMKRARTLVVTNAYDPSEESHAQSIREGYEEDLARGVEEILYHSLEAPEDVPLLPDYTYLDERGHRIREWQVEDGQRVPVPPSRAVIVEYLSWLLRHLRGDAVWLSPSETAKEILRPGADMAEMRRFYTNAIVTGEAEYLRDGDLRATIHPELVERRRAIESGDVLRLGWSIVGPDDPVVMFFDGSKSDDSTGLVGCRISDGYLFTVGVWEKPRGERGNAWLSPRSEVDARVHEAFRTFNVVAFWADPSHAKDDVDGTRYWDGLIDGWHLKYSEQLTHWAQTGGDRRSSIMWDMASPAHTVLFSEAVVRFGDEMDSQNIIWDGHPALRTHLRNARRFMGQYGMIIRKPGRGSGRKIDLAVCAVGAKMLARVVSMQKETTDTSRKPGNVWVPASFMGR